MAILWALERDQVGRSTQYLAVTFQRPSLQLTEDQSEPARGWGHLSRSSPAPPLHLGPDRYCLSPSPWAQPPPCCSHMSGSYLLISPFLTLPPLPTPYLPLRFAFIYFGLAGCSPPTRFTPSGLPPPSLLPPLEHPKKAFVFVHS